MAYDPQLVTLLQLQRTPGVGARTFHQLVAAFGSPDKVLSAARPELLAVPGIGPKTAAAIRESAQDTQAAEQELDRCEELGVCIVPFGHPQYPPLLSQIPDPPALLYVKGTLLERDQLALAMVGSRQSTMYGRQVAERLSGALARAGLTIVSGLARGIDSASHRGALAAGGRTLAILGTGLANIYPPEHVGLAEEIAQSGAVISEMPLDQVATPGVFPLRNRIISGLSLGVLVVEANRNSGALHTVRHATEQGREILAVPGRIDSLASEGCLDLLRDGAVLVRQADDVLETLGPLMQPVTVAVPRNDRAPRDTTGSLFSEPETSATSSTIRQPRELTLNAMERQVLDLVPAEAQSVDELLRGTTLEPSRVLATLTILEMKRFVKRLPGGQVQRT